VTYGTVAAYLAREAEVAQRRARARRKPNKPIECGTCQFLAVGGHRCKQHAAEALAAVASYPAWLTETIVGLVTANRRAAWRRQSAAYRQRHPERRRESVLRYAASPLAAETCWKYRNSARGMMTRYTWQLRQRIKRDEARIAEFDAHNPGIAAFVNAHLVELLGGAGKQQKQAVRR
jgi:hypothetical protein